jgi:hypothetical protein
MLVIQMQKSKRKSQKHGIAYGDNYLKLSPRQGEIPLFCLFPFTF